MFFFNFFIHNKFYEINRKNMREFQNFLFISVFVSFEHYFLHNKHLNIEKQLRGQVDIVQKVFSSFKKIFFFFNENKTFEGTISSFLYIAFKSLLRQEESINLTNFSSLSFFIFELIQYKNCKLELNELILSLSLKI